MPSVKQAKSYYEIPFTDYAIVLYHPVTTDYKKTSENAKSLLDALLTDDTSYVVIYPNNDLGSSEILTEYRSLEGNNRFKIFPSLRFEYFITLLKNAKFLIGNSSAGIHEAPYLGIPTINIGRRQENRDLDTDSIIHVTNTIEAILKGIASAKKLKIKPKGKQTYKSAASQFAEALRSESLWQIDHQKQFRDL